MKICKKSAIKLPTETLNMFTTFRKLDSNKSWRILDVLNNILLSQFVHITFCEHSLKCAWKISMRTEFMISQKILAKNKVMDIFQICHDTWMVSYIGRYLVLTFLEKLISSTSYSFSHFYWSVNCMSQKQPQEVFCKKSCSWKLRKIHRKSLKPAILLKKRLWHRSFPVNFLKFPRTLFVTEHFHLKSYVLVIK